VLLQLEKLGAPADVIESTRQQLEADAARHQVLVWPENWHAVQVFRMMATQWVWVAGMGSAMRTGLRLEALPTVLPAVRPLVHRRWRQPYHVLLQQLQQLEDAALGEWSKRG